MKKPTIEVKTNSDGERVIRVVCREGHEEMELSFVATPRFEGPIRQILTSQWERHRQEKHGGA